MSYVIIKILAEKYLPRMSGLVFINTAGLSMHKSHMSEDGFWQDEVYMILLQLKGSDTFSGTITLSEIKNLLHLRANSFFLA